MKKISMIAALILFSVLTACSSKKEIHLKYNVEEKIESLDPANAVKESEELIISHIFEGLCRINEKGEVVSGAAESWQANQDNTEFTFTLRKNVQWSDKTPLTADDFVFGIQRALLPATKASKVEDLYIIKNAVAVHKGELEPEHLGITAVDEKTIRFTLEKSYADFPRLTAQTRYMPCNQEFFEETKGKYGLDVQNMLTNGPFTFLNRYAWENGSFVKLVKTKNYTGDFSPNATNLTINMYDKEVSQGPIQALSQGKTDVLKLSLSQKQEAEETGLKVVEIEDSVYGLLLNHEAKYLQDKTFREMLMKTIDRESLFSRLSQQKEEAKGLVPKSVRWLEKSYAEQSSVYYPAYEPNILNQLPALLRKNEWYEVPSVKILCRNDAYSQEIANGLIVFWNREFLTSFNLEVVEDDVFNSRLASGDYEAALYTLSTPDSTPNSFFRQFESDENFALMKNREFDLAMQGIQFDIESYQKLEEIIQEEYIFYPLCYETTSYAYSPQSDNITVTPDFGINFLRANKKN